LVRIFSGLAILALLLLAANFAVGLMGGDFGAAAAKKRAAQLRVMEVEQRLRSQRLRASSELDAAQQELAGANAAFAGPRGWMTTHMLLGSAASLVAVLVCSISVTYFIGTSRWCKEVCETYHLNPELIARSTWLKRRTFPWALAGILSIIAIVGLGAAADPSGANYRRAGAFVTPHYAAAMAGLAIVALSFWIQANRIAENYRVIEDILAEVRRLRGEKEPP
jgi:hypothetical protein